MKKTILKSDLDKFMKEINVAMSESKTFYNVEVIPSKHDDKVIVKIG